MMWWRTWHISWCFDDTQIRMAMRVFIRALSSVAAVILVSLELSAQKLATDKGHISFFAKAPVADVDAHNGNVKVLLDTKGQDLVIDMNMSDFQFKSEKMEKDAEKRYLETRTFTKAGFKGKIQSKIEIDKPGSYEAVAIGKLTVHGVEKEFKQKGLVTVDENGQVKIHAEFMLAIKDFNIKTPEILGKKMTEENVKVTIDATLTGEGSDTASKRKN